MYYVSLETSQGSIAEYLWRTSVPCILRFLRL